MDMLSQLRNGDELRFELDACSELGSKKRLVVQNRAKALVLDLRTCIVTRRKFVASVFVICRSDMCACQP